MKKTLITLLLLATVSLSNALEGNFYIQKIEGKSVTIAPVTQHTITLKDARKLNGDTPYNSGRGGSKPFFTAGSTLIKADSPKYVIPFDKLNIQFELGYVFHASYTVTKVVGEFTIIKVDSYEKYNWNKPQAVVSKPNPAMLDKSVKP